MSIGLIRMRSLSALLLLLAVAWLAYAPGLSGSFLFDDFVNLDALGATGPIDNWPAFWRYITSGIADPTGRPLALLSFLLDARDWPADPASFLRTNVILHLLNGALLFALLRKLARALEPGRSSNEYVALLAAGLWLLHPLLVSTTLYAVQREAMLPATMTLLGLLGYAHGREKFMSTQGGRGTLLMAASIVIGTPLAMLCKANGILLPLLAWVLEATVWSATPLIPGQSASRLKRMKYLLLIAPSLVIFAYLGSHLPRLDVDLAARPWTIGQRLLTEPRVLVDYLQLLVVPRSVSTGLYNDGLVVSQTLLDPPSTLPSLLLITILLIGSLRMRRRWPRPSAAVLFYLAGHLLESTVIPLELYFEHRNYLPALLLFWPLAQAIGALQASAAARSGIALALLGLFALTTYQRASLWGQPDKLAELWAIQNPSSARAQATAAMAMVKRGEFRQASNRLGPLWREKPADLQLAFNYIDAVCAWRGVTAQEKQALIQALASADQGQLMIHQWLGRAISAAESQACQGMSLQDVEAWIAAYDRRGAGHRAKTVEPLLGQVALARKQPELALQHFNKALQAFTTPDVAARNASLLASSGYYREALRHLDYYESIKSRSPNSKAGMSMFHQRVLVMQEYWPHEMAALRAKLHAELQAQTP